MATQTGSISFETQAGLNSYAKGQYATLAQVKGQFATSSTAAATAAKVATIVPADSGWELYAGATITVKFTTANDTATPTLNVNSSGAKAIRDHAGAALTEDAYKWAAGTAMAFTYDGTYWRLQDTLPQRVSTAETAIEQTANNVLIKATQTDTTAAQGGQHVIQSLINVAPSGVTIDADKVNIAGATIFTSGRLSETELDRAYDAKGAAQTAVDALEVGGRNLARNTADFANWGYDTSVWSISDGVATYLPPSTRAWKRLYAKQAMPLDMFDFDATYVISFDAKLVSGSVASGDSLSLCIGLYDDASASSRRRYRSWNMVSSLTSEWQRIVKVVTPVAIESWAGTASSEAYFGLEFWLYSSTATIAIKQAMLEKATIASDWSPAPEDSLNGEQLIYRSAVSGTTSVSGTTTWVTDATGSQQTWTTKRPQYSSDYPVLFVATQRQTVGGTVTCTTPMIDDTTTVIDGGNIITNSITAEKIQANSLTLGQINTDVQKDILNSNVQVGGRNLLLGEPTVFNQTGYKTYQVPTTIALNELSEGDRLTIQFWGVDADANSSGIGAFWGGGSIRLAPDSKPDTNGYWSAVYTVTAAHLANANSANKYIEVYNMVSGHSGMSLSIDRWKLERGNKATDWSPAPEDVASDIADAFKTATNYITATSGDGIKVHDANDSSTYVQIVNSAIDLVRSGQSMLRMWTESAVAKLRIGIATAAHIVLDGTGTTFYGPSGSVIAAKLTATTNSLNKDVATLTMGGRDDTYLSMEGDSSAAVVRLSSVAADFELEQYESSYDVDGTDAYTMATLTADAVTLNGSSVSTSGVYPMSRLVAVLNQTTTTTATIGSGASSIATNVVRRWGNVVEVSLVSVTINSAISSGAYSGVLATLPAGYRPVGANVYVAAAFDGATNKGSSYVRITTAGNVAVKNMSGASIASGAVVSCTATFVV